MSSQSKSSSEKATRSSIVLGHFLFPDRFLDKLNDLLSFYSIERRFLLFLAIAGIVFALKSFDCERHGHYEQALIYSRRSFSWSMTTLVMGLFFYLTVGLLIFIRRVQNY